MIPPMKQREAIADKLSAAGWTRGYCRAVTRPRLAVDRRRPRGDGRVLLRPI